MITEPSAASLLVLALGPTTRKSGERLGHGGKLTGVDENGVISMQDARVQ